jgi:hypothetical protein
MGSDMVEAGFSCADSPPKTSTSEAATRQNLFLEIEIMEAPHSE